MPRNPDQIIKRHLHRRVEKRAALLAVGLFLGVLIVVEALAPVQKTNIQAQLPSTQVGASAVSNPVNTLYEEFETLGEELTTREAQLIEREIALGVAERERQSKIVIYFLLGILALVIINSLFDLLEVRELRVLERQIKSAGSA